MKLEYNSVNLVLFERKTCTTWILNILKTMLIIVINKKVQTKKNRICKKRLIK